MIERRALMLGMLAAPALAEANMRRAEAMLDGPRAPLIDPGPSSIPLLGQFTLRILEPYQLRAFCPADISSWSLECTNIASRTITMPNPDDRRLRPDAWLDLLRHGIRHANGGQWHGPR